VANWPEIRRPSLPYAGTDGWSGTCGPSVHRPHAFGIATLIYA
jgi:hypothetical protein